MKVAVLMGGRSAEREVSLSTGRGIAQALRNLGHETTSIDAADGAVLPAGEEQTAARTSAAVAALPHEAMLAAVQAPAVRAADVVFIALHGTWGEDGTIQAALELAGKVYTGPGVLASALAMDKAMSKRIFDRCSIPTPEWALLEPGEDPAGLDLSALGPLPIVVKPNAQGSTVGLTIVRAPGELPGAIELARVHDTHVLFERFVPGRELTVAVIGAEAYPVVEIEPKSGFYDYASKYTKGASVYTCPAKLDEPLARRIEALAVESAKVLGCRGVVRVDFRLPETGEPSVLEVNTLPGMTPTSLVPMAAKARGMSYDQLVQRILDLAVADARRREGERSRA